MKEHHSRIDVVGVYGTHDTASIPQLSMFQAKILEKCMAHPEKNILVAMESGFISSDSVNHVYTMIEDGHSPTLSFWQQLASEHLMVGPNTLATLDDWKKNFIPYYHNAHFDAKLHIVEDIWNQQLHHGNRLRVLFEPSRDTRYTRLQYDTAINFFTQPYLKRLIETARSDDVIAESKKHIKFLAENLTNREILFAYDMILHLKNSRENIGGVVLQMGTAHTSLNTRIRNVSRDNINFSRVITEEKIDGRYTFSPLLGAIRMLSSRAYDSANGAIDESVISDLNYYKVAVAAARYSLFFAHYEKNTCSPTEHETQRFFQQVISRLASFSSIESLQTFIFDQGISAIIPSI